MFRIILNNIIIYIVGLIRFSLNINIKSLILWHDIILYRMIINKNFGMILFKTLQKYINNE